MNRIPCLVNKSNESKVAKRSAKNIAPAKYQRRQVREELHGNKLPGGVWRRISPLETPAAFPIPSLFSLLTLFFNSSHAVVAAVVVVVAPSSQCLSEAHAEKRILLRFFLQKKSAFY